MHFDKNFVVLNTDAIIHQCAKPYKTSEQFMESQRKHKNKIQNSNLELEKLDHDESQSMNQKPLRQDVVGVPRQMPPL